MSTATATTETGIRRVEGAPLLQLENLTMHFKAKGEGLLARGTKWVQAVDSVNFSERRLRPYRREIQLIFQDPYSSLNPRHTVGAIVGTALRTHGMVPKGGELSRVQELLEVVGLNPEHYK